MEREIPQQHHPRELWHEEQQRQRELAETEAPAHVYAFAVVALLCLVIWGVIGYTVWLFVG